MNFGVHNSVHNKKSFPFTEPNYKNQWPIDQRSEITMFKFYFEQYGKIEFNLSFVGFKSLIRKKSLRDFPGGTVIKNLPAIAGDMGLIPGREDLTCRGATKPVRHNYWACALEPVSHNYWSPRA